MCVDEGACVCIWGVKDSAICEHVYAPLSSNPYTFEWQGRLKARSCLDA